MPAARVEGRAAVPGGRAAGLLTALVSLPALGGDWVFTPRVGSTVTLTDNVTLVEQGKSEDLVTLLTPGINIRGEGKRLRAHADASLTRLEYVDNTQFSRNTSQVQANATGIAVEDWLNLEGSILRSQQVVARADDVLPTSLASATGNVAQVSNYRFGPTFNHTFGKFATVSASWRHSIIRTEQDDALTTPTFIGNNFNTDDDVYDARITTGRILPRLPITLSHSVRESRFQVGGTDRIQSSSIGTSYAMNRAFSINGSFGYDDNEPRLAIFETNEGYFWQAGAVFTPNPRASFGFSYGRRFFGDNLNFDAKWTKRRFSLQARYTTAVTTFSSRQEAVQLFVITDAFGNPIVDPLTGLTPVLVVNDTSIVETVSVTRLFALNAQYTLRRHTFNLGVNRNDRQAQTLNAPVDEVASTVNANWSRQLSPGASLSFTTQYLESSFSGVASSNRQFILGPDFRYQISSQLSGTLSYRYTDSSGGNARQQFTENRVTGVFSLTF